MSKCGSGKSSKGGSSKGSSGSVASSVTRSKALKTPAEKLVSLRSALRDDSGMRDRDVAAELLPALLAFSKNGLDVAIKFYTGSTLTKELRQFMFRLAKKNTKAISDASGYGWDDDEYKEALKAPEERFLVAFAAETESTAAAPVAFIDFQFALQGALVEEMEGETCLLVQDLQLQKAVQRKGLGRHLLSLAQLIARKQGMSTVATKVFTNDDKAQAFMTQMPGFAVTYEFVAEGEPLEVWEKSLTAAAAQVPPTAAVVTTPSKKEPLSLVKEEAAVSPPTSPDAVENAPAPTASTPMTAADKKKARKKAQKARKKAADKAAAAAAATSSTEDAGQAGSAQSQRLEELSSQGESKVASVEQQFSAASLGNAFKIQNPEETQAATLRAFYAHLKVTKSDAEVDEILRKRRESGASNWFEVLCGKLEKKYGVSPRDAYEQSQAHTGDSPAGLVATPRPLTPAPQLELEQDITPQEVASLVTQSLTATADVAAAEEDQVDTLLEELMDLFKEQNGRDPTDEEVKQWMETLKEVNQEQEQERSGDEID
jgi:GNAT superfamily N-acetyltransferase